MSNVLRILEVVTTQFLFFSKNRSVVNEKMEVTIQLEILATEITETTEKRSRISESAAEVNLFDFGIVEQVVGFAFQDKIAMFQNIAPAGEL